MGYLQGHVMELGPTMPSMQSHISHPSAAFICFARALVFEGSTLTCDSTTKQAKWVPVRGTAADLSLAEERSALVLCNLVPRDEERRDMGSVAGGGAEEDPSLEAPCTANHHT